MGGRKPHLPREEERRRREAYRAHPGDGPSAEALGMNRATFGAWRRARGLPTKRPPGQGRHMTEKQEAVLRYLEEHPWSRMYEMALGLEQHSWSLHGMLQRLEMKGLLDVCTVDRVKRWALTGTPPPKGGMKLLPGAPSPFALTHVPRRIVEILEREPWLTASMIARRVGGVAATKTVTERVREMANQGKLQRHLVDTPMRRMYAFALPDAPGFRGPHAVRVRREIQEATGFWKAHDQILEALRLRPWQTAPQLTRTSGVGRGYIYNALRALKDQGRVRRVRVLEDPRGQGRGARYRWALHDAEDPPERDPGPDRHETALTRVALLVQEQPGRRAGFYTAEYGRRYNHVTYGYVCGLLKRLEELGTASRVRRGSHANRWQVNGEVDALRLHQAQRYRDVLDRTANRLRHLGFRVRFEVTPAQEETLDG